MTTDLSLFHLISGASIVVQLVLLLLLIVSLASWTIIFRKWTDVAVCIGAAGHGFCPHERACFLT